MNKRQKPSKPRRGAGITFAVCFVAAAVMVGTYTIQSSRELQRRQQEQEEEAKEKEQAGQEEAGSSLVINTREDPDGEAGDGQARDGQAADPKDAEGAAPQDADGTSAGTDAGTDAESGAQTGGNAAQTAGSAGALQFGQDSILLWPVDGNVLMNYSMDKTVYFSTLDQYKYNPALIISGAEGDQVISSAPGVVKSIDESAQTGTTVNIDIGGGYELFYGQLKDVTVNTGDRVEAKTVIGYVAQPTKYYSVEGCNVYFEMRKDGQPVDPVDYMAD